MGITGQSTIYHDLTVRDSHVLRPYLPIETPDVTDEFTRKFANAHTEKLNTK